MIGLLKHQSGETPYKLRDLIKIAAKRLKKAINTTTKMTQNALKSRRLDEAVPKYKAEPILRIPGLSQEKKSPEASAGQQKK